MLILLKIISDKTDMSVARENKVCSIRARKQLGAGMQESNSIQLVFGLQTMDF